jgi:hypothetical protein
VSKRVECLIAVCSYAHLPLFSVKNCTKDLKVKAKAPLTEFLETVKTTLAELERSSQTESLRYQLMHMRDILERWKIVGCKYGLAPAQVQNIQAIGDSSRLHFSES